jgi:Smg protein
MFEVLVYLFENYFEANIRPDQDTLVRELFAAGFDESDISRAFDWFTTLEEMTRHMATSSHEGGGGLRIYADVESNKINLECQGFLIFLEQAGVIDAAQRELAIDRAMALPDSKVTLEQIKWIMLMTMWNQGRARDYLFVEDAVFSDVRPTMH